MKKLISLTIIASLIFSCDKQQPKNVLKMDNERIIEKKVDSLLLKMTLNEKVGQMLNIGLPSILKGDYWDERDSAEFDEKKFQKFIVDYGVGSIHNTPQYLAGRGEWYKIVKKIQDASLKNTRLGIPVLYGIDNIHGANYIKGSVLFPHQIALAATWNRELSATNGEITSYESRAASLPWNFNPNIDVAINPLWGRISESFGEDPYLISEMGVAYLKGSQGENLQNIESSAVCLKHFIGYGAGRNGKDRANAIIPENSLRQYFIPPFKKAIDEGAVSVMISSNAVNGIPCHINKHYITDILKGELGFKGVVISDFSDVEFLIEAHEVTTSKREATKMAVNAGLDMLMNPYDIDVVDYIVEMVENNEISMERIDDAVTRILNLKFHLNLFNKPYNNPKDFPDFGSEKHIAANYNSAAEAITLLKNNKAVLPLEKGKKILVTGYAANSMNLLNGAWSRTFLGQDTKYNDPSKLTILKAIEKEVGAKNVTYVEGTNYTEDINTSKAVSQAKNADYIVVCIGELPATEKPSDINELDLPKAQQELVKKLAIYKKPIILVMVQGRPRIIREIEPLADGILMGYYPGQEGGRAISDVLFGHINPSGKLPYTYPKYSGNAVTYYHKKADIRDVNWGYDGFYTQFEFGHGLSYTSFEYSNFVIEQDTLSGDEALKISVSIKNTGNREGKEVVQLYLKDLVASVAPDSKRLIRFEKINLQPNETKTIEFTIQSADLKFIGMDNTWTVEEGEFELQIGGNPKELFKKQFYYKE
ncbi:glycoside hydrolase family 3 N-terminal domain-containing protein [Lutibacter flavus]|uniref:beta-glucosidase n=1 Tax=Lutibacter flavus TaxID=691689 RepID=A0A238YF10_9FLAO|nr:glycoside hydrolase family 3 N-terminal domain-containing protein [Lutibacter flavus]SNR69737.1 beta-glucosidase [Lutibacter flavus]